MLAPMALARPQSWVRLALLTTITSVLGGLFGYLIGWTAGALVTGWVMSRLPSHSPRLAAFGAFAAAAVGGLGVVHLSGVVGLVHLAHLSWSQALMGTLVFVPGDLVKCALCALVVHTIARGLPDWRFGGRASL